MPKPTVFVAPVHFEDFSGEAFERLVFAYHLRVEWWHQIEWYGQVGSDSGRDIWASRTDSGTGLETMCIQCVNRHRLTKAKARSDIQKILKGPKGVPTTIRFVCRSDISAALRDAINGFPEVDQLKSVEIWSGQEYEERLRAFAESLLHRFCEGVLFPDSPTELGKFVSELPPLNDTEIVARISQIFDRPAFTTPFYAESSLGEFEKAIACSIEALNTGICRTNDGIAFSKIHCRHDLQDPMLKQCLADVTRKLNDLRVEYINLRKKGEIKECESGGHMHLSSLAIQAMDDQRTGILEDVKLVCPTFSVKLKSS